MGHMDVIPIISDGFNVYFPMAILAFCLATYFSIGSRLLSMLGFQQFLDDDEFTTDLVEEGRELIKRGMYKRYINSMFVMMFSTQRTCNRKRLGNLASKCRYLIY